MLSFLKAHPGNPQSRRAQRHRPFEEPAIQLQLMTPTTYGTKSLMREYINETKYLGFMATRNAKVKKRPWWNMRYRKNVDYVGY